MSAKCNIAAMTVAAMVAAIGCSRKATPETSLILDIATAPKSCGETHHIVATSVGSGRGQMNSEPAVPLDQLAARIRDLQRTRFQRVLYVRAEAGVQWGDFMSMVERLWPDADVVSIITPQVEHLARQRYCLAPSCRRCETVHPRILK